MAIVLSSGLAAIVNAEPTQYDQVRALDTALTVNKRIKVKHSTTNGIQQKDVWTTGTLIRDAALTGAFTLLDNEIIKYGVTSDLTTCLSANIGVGLAVMRIEGGGHWVEGTFGLPNSGADFIFPVNPTTTNSIAIAGSFRLHPNPSLPDGIPDRTNPQINLATSSNNFSAEGILTLTATATDDFGVDRVEFYKDGDLIATKNAAPFTHTEDMNYMNNGVHVFSARAFDAAGNSSVANAPVSAEIAAPIETGTAVAVNAQLTDVSFTNTSASVQTNVPVTFGQVFAVGALPASGAAVGLRAPDNSEIACQMDVKATHPDGSVRHAIISAVIPSMSGLSNTTYAILRKSSGATGIPATPSDFTGLNAVVDLAETGTELSGPTAATNYTANAAAKLAAGQYETWLSGPICTEWIVRVPFKDASNNDHPSLHARFSIRAYKGLGKAKIDYIVENAWAKKKATPSGVSPWEVVSTTPHIYRFSLTAGNTVAHTRTTKGYTDTPPLANGGGVHDGNSTRLPNNSTVYTATVEIDGQVRNISITGSAAQTHGNLKSLITTQLDGYGVCVADPTNIGLRVISNNTAVGSYARITNFGSLFPALKGTGLDGNTQSPVTYTATITINGTLVKNISLTGNTAQSFGELCAVLNTQMGGDATATPQLEAPGIRFVSTSTGQTSDVVITNKGTLFSITENNYMKPYRPIYGGEYLHYPRTRWKLTHWWGAEPQVHIAHNKAYLMASKAVPNYDPTLTGSSTTIASRLSELNANGDLGQHGTTKAYMGDVGYASGIGILPEWCAMYLVNQGKDAKYVMLKQADLQGSWPIFTRDFDTDRPINFVDWPYASYSPSGSDSTNPATSLQEKIPEIVIPQHIMPNRNRPDVAHHPDFCFLPYMVTGDHCYMEGMLFYQRYTALQANAHAAYRDGRKALWHVDQVRGQAWMMRTAIHTHYLIPTSHPLRDDVKYQIDQNRIWYQTNYLDHNAPHKTNLSFIKHGSYSVGYKIKDQSNVGAAGWMDDYFTSCCARAMELGYREYEPMFRYKSKSPVGRLTSGPDLCWQVGMGTLALRIRETSGSPIYTTWRQVFEGTFSDAIVSAQCGSQAMTTAMTSLEGSRQTVGSFAGYPDQIGGYVANSQPAVAYGVTYGVDGGEDAWLVYEGRSLKPNYNEGPQFAIVPRSV